MTTHLLELYVSGDSVRSREARMELERICESRLRGDYELVVVDVESDPDRARTRGVDSTPTLIRLDPPPEVRILGDVGDEAALFAALGLDRR